MQHNANRKNAREEIDSERGDRVRTVSFSLAPRAHIRSGRVRDRNLSYS